VFIEANWEERDAVLFIMVLASRSSGGFRFSARCGKVSAFPQRAENFPLFRSVRKTFRKPEASAQEWKVSASFLAIIPYSRVAHK
jgi:hypothetical protein